MQLQDRYHEALSMQRHYDSLSQLAVSGITVVAGGIPFLFKALDLQYGGVVFFAAIPLLFIAFAIYERFDAHAAYALMVAAIYEESDDLMNKPVRNGMVFHGPAHAFSERERYGLKTRAGGGVHRMVKTFVWSASLVYVVAGGVSIHHAYVAAASKPAADLKLKARTPPVQPSAIPGSAS